MRSPLHFVFIIALLTAAACNAGGGNPTTAPPSGAPATASAAPTPDLTEIQLLTEPQPSDACMDALATGTLVPDPTTGLAIASGNGERTTVMWPFGYTARLVDNVIELYDDHGIFVAREGDVVSMGGGFGANNLFYACGGSVQLAN